MSGFDERDFDAARKRAARSKAAEIAVPKCVNPARRKTCLEDPELFLKTYFPERFYLPFSDNHREMIAAINLRSVSGGDQAIAAPRGEGKTEVTTGMIIYLILKERTRFPLIVAATGVHAERIYSDIKSQFERNELLFEDFPEVCAPVVALEGAPQRAARQHIDGKLTRIEWKQKHCYFPFVPGSKYGGVCLAFAGLDSAIRGLKIHGNRPDFALIDDPETKESADSDLQIKIRSELIDRDIAGLAGPGKTLTRVMLCTVQNTKCVSYIFTDPGSKPSWNGKRYRWVESWPENEDFWNEYMEQRKSDMREGDPYGQTATQMYLDNREMAERGAKVSNQYRFCSDKLANGMQVEYSAIQAAYNKIADNGIDAFLSEYQNDPRKEEGPETRGLTPELVMTRISGLDQGEVPENYEKVTAFLDLGKYGCHWAVTSWRGNAIGNIVDYGYLEMPEIRHGSTDQAIELALLSKMSKFRDDLLAEYRPDLVMLDSGKWSKTVYQFVREVGGTPFVASKGWGGDSHYRAPKPGDQVYVGDNWNISLQPAEGIWLYNFNVDFWKGWVHDRFLTRTFDENQAMQDGTLSLFVNGGDRRRHFSFAQHICAEEFREIFKPEKGLTRKWVKVKKQNHWLDCMVGCCVAANILGIHLMRARNDELMAKAVASQRAGQARRDEGTGTFFQNQHGQQFLLTER